MYTATCAHNLKMPRRTQSQSQASTSSQQDNNATEAGDALVTFILSHTDNARPLRKRQLHAHLKTTHPGQKWKSAITAAAQRLRSVYGFELCAGPDSEKFFVRTCVPQVPTAETTPSLQDLHNSVKFVVLSHIFLSGGKASEASIMTMLDKLGIDDADGATIDTQTFYKNLCAAELISVLEVDGATMVTWGAQADLVVSKMDMLAQLKKVYGRDEVPKYAKLHEEAMEQQATYMSSNNDF